MIFFEYQFASLFDPFFIQKGTKPFKGISTDTRTLTEGEIFLVLNGPNFNGADYIPIAIKKDASGIICKKEDLPSIHIDTDISIICVESPIDFYQQVAFLYLKNNKNVLTIAITGSVGKTSIKEWLYQILIKQFTVYKSPGNINNLLGVPRSILEIKKEQIAILELGSGKPGDIDKLASLIEPAVGIVSNVGPTHLEFFGSLDAIAKEKSALLKYSDRFFVPHDILYKEEYFKSAVSINPSLIFDSIEDLGINGYKIFFKGEQFYFPFYGEHNLTNLAIVLHIVSLLNVSPSQIAQTNFEPLPSYRHQKIVINKTTLILDCYNANPLSIEKGLIAIDHFNQPTILVLGDMLELGENALQYHKQCGEKLNTLKNTQMVYFIGPLMKEAYDSYHSQSKMHFSSIKDCEREIKKIDTKKNQLIFVKGSRGMHLEDMRSYLQER